MEPTSGTINGEGLQTPHSLLGRGAITLRLARTTRWLVRTPAAYQNDRQDPRTKISSLGCFRGDVGGFASSGLASVRR
jgi:hypothetical protein